MLLGLCGCFGMEVAALTLGGAAGCVARVGGPAQAAAAAAAAFLARLALLRLLRAILRASVTCALACC